MKSIISGYASGARLASFAARRELDAATFVRVLALVLVPLIVVACTAESSGQGTPETISEFSAGLQANCGCNKTGAYVPPSTSAPVSNSPTFTVATTVTNGSTRFVVYRRSDNASVYTAFAPVRPPTTPATIWRKSTTGWSVVFRAS